MEITIYLPDYAREQLETCDDSSVWARPIPFSESPNEDFPLSLKFDSKDERFYDPTDSRYFYPDRTEPETVLELLVEVDPSEYVVASKEIKAGEKGYDLDKEDEEKDTVTYADSLKEGNAPGGAPKVKLDIPLEEEEEETDKREVVDSATLEGIIAKHSDKKLHISGPTMLCTSGIGYEAFFDQDSKLISCIYENDANFRDEYQAGLFEHFGIAVKRFSLPKELEELAEAVDNDDKRLEGQDESSETCWEVIEKIIQPYLKSVLEKD